MSPAEEAAPEGVDTPTQSLSPTVADIKNWLEAPFTVKPETQSFVPLKPNTLPGATTAETPLMAAAEDESTKTTESEKEEETVVEEITEPSDEGEVPSEEQLRGVGGGGWSPVGCQGEPSLKI